MLDFDKIDEMLASEMSFGEGEPDTEETEEPIGNELEEPSLDDFLTDVESEEATEEEVDKEPIPEEAAPAKPSKEEKKDYAFNELRKENDALKQEKERLADYEATIKELALSNGYTDVEAFKVDLKAAQLAKEAQEKGVDPRLYKETAELKEKVARLEAENQQKELIHKAEIFRGAVDKAVSDYDLGEDGRGEIFTRLEEAGYTVDLILQLPNPKIVIDGLLSDKIQERSTQEQLKKIEKLDKVADEKHTSNSSNSKVTIDDLLRDDLSDYKERNNY